MNPQARLSEISRNHIRLYGVRLQMAMGINALRGCPACQTGLQQAISSWHGLQAARILTGDQYGPQESFGPRQPQRADQLTVYLLMPFLMRVDCVIARVVLVKGCAEYSSDARQVGVQRDKK